MLCLECGKNFRSLTHNHLKSCCGLTPQEYKSKHNTNILMDDDVRKSYGKAGEKNNNWRGGKTQKDCEICGKKLSKHNYVKRCVKCMWFEKDNPFLGQKHSDKTKVKMRVSAKKRDRSKETKRPNSKEQNKRHSEWAKNLWANMSKEEKSNRLEKFIKAGIKASRKSAETKIENFINQILESLNIEFFRNKYIHGKVVDFLLDDKIIECYGDYWHCNPKIYQDSSYNKSLHMSAKEKWEKDDNKIKMLTAKGFSVKIFWESDIKNNPKTVEEELKIFLNLKDV